MAGGLSLLPLNGLLKQLGNSCTFSMNDNQVSLLRLRLVHFYYIVKNFMLIKHLSIGSISLFKLRPATAQKNWKCSIKDL